MSSIKKYILLKMIPAGFTIVITALGGWWGSLDPSVGIAWGCIYGVVFGTIIGKLVNDMMHHMGLF